MCCSSCERLNRHLRMAGRIDYYMYLLSWLLVLAHQGLSQDQGFVVQPSNTEVIQGESVTMFCEVRNRVGSVQWTRSSFALGVERSLPGFDRYLMRGTDGSGIYDLVISNAQLEDDATYQCQIGATQDTSGVRSSDANLTVLIPPDTPIIEGGPTVEVVAGQPFNLTCRANNGKPAPTLRWYTEGVEITSDITYTSISHANKLEDAISILNITASKLDQDKEFECHALNGAIVNSKLVKARLEVLYAPEVIMVVTPKESVRTGENVQFECSAKGNPNNITWRWYRNNEEISAANDQYLRVTAVERDHNGAVISCEAINKVGSTKVDHKLEVEFGPVFTESVKHAAADLGKTATLTCNVIGNPAPNIVWMKKGFSSILATSPKFTIQHVREKDLGVYICKASVRGFQEVSREIHLMKKGPPKVVSNKDQYAREGDIALLECEAESIPKPDKISWARASETIVVEMETRYTIIEEDLPNGRKSVLKILDVHSGDYGDYNCSVSNQYGQDAAVIRLVQKDVVPLAYVMGGVFGGIGVIILIALVIFLCQRRKRHADDSTDDTESTDSAKKNKPDIKLEYKNQDTDYSGEPWRTDYDKDQYRYSAEYDELHQDVTYGKDGRPYVNGYGFPPQPTYQRFEYPDALERGYPTTEGPYDRSYDSGFVPDYHPRSHVPGGYGRPPPSIDSYSNDAYGQHTVRPATPSTSRLSTNV